MEKRKICKNDMQFYWFQMPDVQQSFFNGFKCQTTATFHVEWLKHTNLYYANYTNGLEMLIQKRLSILYEGIKQRRCTDSASLKFTKKSPLIYEKRIEIGTETLKNLLVWNAIHFLNLHKKLLLLLLLFIVIIFLLLLFYYPRKKKRNSSTKSRFLQWKCRKLVFRNIKNETIVEYFWF